MKKLNAIKPRYYAAALIALAALSLFFLRGDLLDADSLLNSKPLVGRVLQCKPKRIDQNVLKSRMLLNDDIRLLVGFNEKPSMDLREYLSENGITIYLNSWVQDFLVAETTVGRLCFLDQLPGVEFISLGQI